MSGSDPAAEDDQDLSAAEYVLGALAPEQARAMEALALADPAVAASILAWQDRLAPLASMAAPVQPPPELWRRLALATGLEGRRRRRPPVSERLWDSLGLWRFATIGSMAVAAALAFVVLRPIPPTLPGYLAALSPVGAPGATFLVRIAADGAAVIVAAAPPSTPPGRALELWALSQGATAPVSLGVLPSAGRARLQAPPRAGTQLLVSVEPPGGSPTGQPTGPVVYSGAIASGS